MEDYDYRCFIKDMRSGIKTDIGTENGTHGSERLTIRSPNGEKAVISPAFLNRGDGLKKRCFPWFRKPMFMASA